MLIINTIMRSFREDQIPLRKYFFLLLVPVLSSFVVCAYASALPFFSGERLAAAKIIFPLHDYGYIITYAGASDSLPSTGAYTLTSIFTFATYAVILYSSFRVWRHMRQAVRLLSSSSNGIVESRVSEAYTQLNFELAAQSVGPLLFAILPLFYLEAIRLFNGDNGDGSNTERSLRSRLHSQSLVTVCLNWLPMTNGIVTLVIIKPYRRFVIDRLCPVWIRGKLTSETSVRVMAQPTNQTVSHIIAAS